MDRNSNLYKLRRKLQIIASVLLPDSLVCKIYSMIILKRTINLKKPKTFNEKIQWLKINDYPNNELVIKCADKYRVREYIKEKKLESILVPLIGEWEKPEDIEWKKLPNKFVLKCNHGCAYNIICSDKHCLDENETKEKLNKWMKEDFGKFNIERHYSKIIPHITCEEYLGEKITDYKFFCFNGTPKYIYISNDLAHDREAQIGFYDLEGKKLPLIRNDYAPMDIDKFPSFFEKMKNDAKKLCEDFDFVRIDFFVFKDKYYFAELTFTPSGGMMPFNPDKYDLEWGNELVL